MEKFNDERSDWQELYKELNEVFKSVPSLFIMDDMRVKLYDRIRGFFHFSDSEAAERIVIRFEPLSRTCKIGIRGSKKIREAYVTLDEALREGLTLKIKF